MAYKKIIKRILNRILSRFASFTFQPLEKEEIYKTILKLIQSGQFEGGEAAVLIARILSKTETLSDPLRLCLIRQIAWRHKFKEVMAVEAINAIATQTENIGTRHRALTIKSLAALAPFSEPEAVETISEIAKHSGLTVVFYTRVDQKRIKDHIMSFMEMKGRN